MSSSANLVALRTDGSVIDIPALGLDSLWVRQGTHAGTGALIGFAVGGLGLGIAGAASTSSYGPPPTKGDVFLIGLLVGGVGGAVVGALAGVGIPKWQRQVP